MIAFPRDYRWGYLELPTGRLRELFVVFACKYARILLFTYVLEANTHTPQQKPLKNTNISGFAAGSWKKSPKINVEHQSTDANLENEQSGFEFHKLHFKVDTFRFKPDTIYFEALLFSK